MTRLETKRVVNIFLWCVGLGIVAAIAYFIPILLIPFFAGIIFRIIIS